MMWYWGNSANYFMGNWWGGLIPLALWSVFWTGMALWYAAKRDEKAWFILFLFIHTLGILEIIYLLLVVKAFSNKKPVRSRRR